MRKVIDMSKNNKEEKEKMEEEKEEEKKVEETSPVKEEVQVEEKQPVVDPVNHLGNMYSPLPNQRVESPKKKKTVFYVIGGILLLLIVIIATALIAYHLMDKASTNKEKEKEKIELNYTNTSDTPAEGIYITDVSEVVSNVMPSIVAITSKTLISSGSFGPSYFGRERYSEGAGSGIIVSQSDTDILILTNNHVVDDAAELSVQFINEKSYDAKIVGTSERKDIAIISVPLKDLDEETLKSIKIATMGDSDQLKVGNGIIAIGNALGYGQSVTTGVVSALDREVSVDNYTNKMIQIDAAINGGNSGGALLNSKGEVVGINSAKYSSNGSYYSTSIEGMGFAIPISDVKNLITSLMNGEESGMLTLGIEGYIIAEQNGVNYNIPAGFYVSKIVSGGSADKSDLEIGNIITKINGNKVTSVTDIQDVLEESKKGDKVTLTVRYVSGREYREKEVVVTLS